ncbi:site-specific DNA-methyltransferase [Porifericola rhodea]|uniref:DNA-methyltransferase n=1 Tax=Porifericola rhodea TaxID=930972 RepID=UPI00266501E9|nr:site-specific DNA-methyltransferase [Porifericola rhodea]WKN32918.1 site-specific DNA-methyltransferase [Porifericola rhodea]
MSEPYTLYLDNCYGLSQVADESVDALVTDPPYGIGFQTHAWDRNLPDPQIWNDCLRVLKPGAFGLIFSSVRLMHRLMVAVEDRGFLIKDVLFWAFLNGMPKSRNVGLSIDRSLGVESEVDGYYQYVQGYKKGGADSYTISEKKARCKPASEEGKRYNGAGLGVKPAYEPIILIQKPLDTNCNVAENIIKHGTGALNLEETRLPFEKGEAGKIGHNPHPKGRVPANIIRTEAWDDGYDKFFLVPKVRQHAEDFNKHPTLKPVQLMQHLVKLVSFEGQLVLDPFMGSGSTGIACQQLERRFLGYESNEEYYRVAQKRLDMAEPLSPNEKKA